VILLLVALGAAVLLAAWEWGRFCARCYLSLARWASSLDKRAAKPRSARSFLRSPLLGDRSSSSVEGSRGPEHPRPDQPPSSPEPPLSSPLTAGSTRELDSRGEASDGSSVYDQPPRVDFGRRDYHGIGLLAAVPVGTALQPDFDAFFGGLEAAVATGGVLVIAVVVVMTIRRFVSF
jgi:hypothetical protein